MKPFSPDSEVDLARPKVRHRLDFNLSVDLYGWLVNVAETYGLIHDEGGRPRIAELVRVLLSSALRTKQPVGARVAFALYSHTVLGLSEHLALLVAGLRDSIGELAATAAGTRLLDDTPELHPVRGSARSSGTLTLVLDDALHDALAQELQNHGAPPFVRGRGDRRREPPADVRLVRGLIERARVEFARSHRIVVERYAKAVSRLRAAVRSTVEAERDAVREMLREAATEK